jgi:hypothetical protein
MSKEPTDIQAKERERDAKREQERLASRQEAEDFKWLMSDKRGRRVVWGLLDRAGVFRTSFTGNSETFFREGQRNMGLMIITTILEQCPERYHQMVMENTCQKLPR